MSETTIAAALPGYFRAAGLPDDGGYAARWVRVEVGPVPLFFPNIEARRRAVRYHDVHHLLTGYPTTWTGEAEISAWEIASGCGRYWVAWVINGAMLALGLLIAPRAMFRAWCRGRRSRNLYGEPYEPILREQLTAVRSRLGLDRRPVPARFSDAVTFAVATGASLALQLAAVALTAAAIL